jgi:purine-nucleoside phosphorylase
MLHEGVYGYYQGPTYETNAEVRFQKKFNIDAAGMSTVPESNEACKRGINVIAISVVTNLLNENRPEPASHESVIEKAKAASVGLNKALSILIPQLN